jgi:AcrR family transcriptional regulator
MRAARKDGVATRERLLDAATEVFADRGYAGATVSEICERAGANLAAINYHFGGKDELYAETWRTAFEAALSAYPPDGGLPDDAPVESRFHAFVSSLLHRILEQGKRGHGGKLLLSELANPTEAIQDVRTETIRPLFEQSRALMREVLGPTVDEKTAAFATMSVVNQCLAIGFQRGRFPAFQNFLEMAETDVDGLADHISRFSLAGIAAVREKAEEGV